MGETREERGGMRKVWLLVLVAAVLAACRERVEEPPPPYRGVQERHPEIHSFEARSGECAADMGQYRISMDNRGHVTVGQYMELDDRIVRWEPHRGVCYAIDAKKAYDTQKAEQDAR